MAEICIFFVCKAVFTRQDIYIKGYNMNKNFKNWLINNDYKLFTSNNQPRQQN